MRVLKLAGAIGFIILLSTFSQSLQAQEIGVLRVQSLNRVFDGVEAVAQAAGFPVDRQALLSTALGMTGFESSELLDMSKPVAVVVPVEVMMLQQNAVVAAVPVTDVAAAIALVEQRFVSRTSEGQLHTFATDQGPVLFLLEGDGYIRIGGSSELVSRVDPLAGEPSESAISLEIFLEPVAPMIHAGMEAARQQIKSEIQSDTAGEDVPINPEAVGSIIDLYLEGVRSVVNNTSSIRFDIDVKDGYFRFSESLTAKQDSSLAQFIAHQTPAKLGIARLADPGAAFFSVGSINLSDEHRVIAKEFFSSYMDLVREMFNVSKSEAVATEDAGEVTEQVEEAATQEGSASSFWMEYFDIIEPYTLRWLDCLRGDFAVSFDFSGGFTFMESFGLTEPQTCQDLHSEMSGVMEEKLAQSSEMASVISISKGPELGQAASTLITMDTIELAKMVDPGSAEEAEEVMRSIYGEKLTIGWASFDEWTVITGGESSVKMLQDAHAGRATKAKLPSFKLLGEDLSVMTSLNLGRFASGIQGFVPEGGEDLGTLSQRLSGEAGHIPMGLRFAEQTASFDLAVPLKTIEVIAGFAAEMEAKEQAAEPDPAVEETDPAEPEP
jgi:hypothetical protein